MYNPKDNLVRMIKTMFGISTIRKCVVSVLEVEVKLNLPTNTLGSDLNYNLNFTGVEQIVWWFSWCVGQIITSVLLVLDRKFLSDASDKL